MSLRPTISLSHSEGRLPDLQRVNWKKLDELTKILATDSWEDVILGNGCCPRVANALTVANAEDCNQFNFDSQLSSSGVLSIWGPVINSFHQFLIEEQTKSQFVAKMLTIKVLSVAFLSKENRTILKKILVLMTLFGRAFANLRYLKLDGFADLKDWSIPKSMKHFEFYGSINEVDICNFENLKSIKFSYVSRSDKIILANLPSLQSLTFETLCHSFILDCNLLPSLVHMEANKKFAFVKIDNKMVILEGCEQSSKKFKSNTASKIGVIKIERK